jgi:hypothetical protein
MPISALALGWPRREGLRSLEAVQQPRRLCSLDEPEPTVNGRWSLPASSGHSQLYGDYGAACARGRLRGYHAAATAAGVPGVQSEGARRGLDQMVSENYMIS